VFVLFALYFFVLRPAVMGSAMEGVESRILTVSGPPDLLSGHGRSVIQNILTQSRVFWLYAGLVLFPKGLALDHQVAVSTSIGEPSVLLALAGLAVVVVLLVLAARRRPLIAFAGGVVFFGLAPTWVIPLNVVMNEHRLYLPGVGIAILLAWPLAALLARRRAAGIALGAVIAVCWVLVITVRNLEWQDAESLWRSNVRAEPLSHRAHNQLGALRFEAAARYGLSKGALPLIDAAIAEYRIAADLYPRWYDARYNLGIAYHYRGRITGEDADFEKSIENLEAAIDRARLPARARYWLATTYGEWGKYDVAIRLLTEMADEDRSERSGKRLTLYLFPLAQFLRDKGDAAAAERVYAEIVDATPEDPAGHFGRAKCLLDLGEKEAAAEAYRQALERGHRGTPKERRDFLGE
jgi:tetratricopeptide (TPR) repeat protein